MLEGIWQHRDVVGDAFTFIDLLDAHEILDLRQETEYRARKWAERNK